MFTLQVVMFGFVAASVICAIMRQLGWASYLILVALFLVHI